MTEKTETTVSKCPSCGGVTPGIPAKCPSCGYRFSDFKKTLPAVRQATEEVGTLQPGKAARTALVPRSVLVPFLAGLLVAVVVAVFVRLSASEHRAAARSETAGSNQSGARGNTKAAKNAQPKAEFLAASKGIEQKRKEQGTAVRDEALLRLGPNVSKVVPVDVGTGGMDSEKGDVVTPDAVLDVDTLIDSNYDTCLVTDNLAGKDGIQFFFDGRMRFSHVVVHVTCLRHVEPGRVVEGSFVTEDGSRRLMALPARPGAVSVDLAGVWTSVITMDLGKMPGQGIGVSELEFFAFEDGAEQK